MPIINIALFKFLILCYNRSPSTQYKIIEEITFKGRVHCFSMQVVMNKCFLKNPEKNLSHIRFVVFEKNAHFNSEK